MDRNKILNLWMLAIELKRLTRAKDVRINVARNEIIINKKRLGKKEFKSMLDKLEGKSSLDARILKMLISDVLEH